MSMASASIHFMNTVTTSLSALLHVYLNLSVSHQVASIHWALIDVLPDITKSRPI